MPTVDSYCKNSVTFEDCDKINMDLGNGHDKGKSSDEIRNTCITNQDDPHLFDEDTIENNSTTTTSSSTEESLKMRSLSKTEHSVPILQLSPNNSHNMFSSDEEGGFGDSIIPPSPEALSPAAKRLLPGTPTRDAPSPNTSEHSNGNVSSKSGSNHSKTLHMRPSSFSKRITFSQDSNSQSDTPAHTKHQIADYVQRNIVQMDCGNSLKRSIKDGIDSNSDSSEEDVLNFPKRRKDTMSESNNLTAISAKQTKNYTLRESERCESRQPNNDRDPLLSCGQVEPLHLNAPAISDKVPLLDSEILRKPEEINNDDDIDDLRLYLSATYTSPQKEESDSEANTSDDKNEDCLGINESVEEGCHGLTNKVSTRESAFSINLPALPTVGTETEESQKDLTPLSSVFAKVQQNDKASKNKLTEEKAPALEPSVFDKSDNTSILAECSQQTIDSNCSFEFGTESQEIQHNLQALHSTRRNRILDTQDIAKGLFTQPFAANSSQKRTHSSDENEPKKNMRIQNAGTPEGQECENSAAETPVLCKIREKIVKQIYKDEYNDQGELVKSALINEETITEHFLDRASSIASYYSSLSSGELADHSSLPLSKSTSSMENLNITISGSQANNSGQLDRSKASSTSTLDRSPPILKPNLPITAKNVLNVTSSSSTSEELIFKTPHKVGRLPKVASAKGRGSRSPKRKAKVREAVDVSNLQESDPSSSISSPDDQQALPDPSDPNAVYSGMKIMAKWGDGFYYSGKVGKQKPNEEWQVIFDDGSIKDVKRHDFFPSSLIKPGQSVLALLTDGYFDYGVIQESYSLEQEEGYVIDFKNGFSLRCKRENVTLSSEQAASIIPSASSSLAASKLLGPDLNLDNIVEGKRRRTPATSITTPMKYSLTKRGQDPNLDPTTETDSSTGSYESIKPKRLPNTSQGRKKAGSIKKGDSSSEGSPKRSPTSRNSPKTNFCTACGETDKTHSNVCPKTSPILQRGTRRKQEVAVESQSSPEIRRLGNSPSPMRPQRVKRSLTTEFERMVHDTPEEKSTIFHGYYFLISCADRCNEKQYDSSGSSATSQIEVIPFNKDQLLKLLELGGGQVLTTFEETQSVSSKKVFLISNTYLRTLKYIKCLASGIPCVKFDWVLDCCKQRKRLELQPYHLSAGFSIVERETIPWHGRNTILKGLHILLVSKSNPMFMETWKPVLLAAQAEAVHRISNKQSTHKCMLNVVVSDQSCPGHVVRRASDLSIPIVSSEWIIQCLINGKRLPYNGHKKFDYLYDDN